MTTSKRAITEKQKLTAQYANALSHPIRIAILQMLAQQTHCFHGDMAEILPIAPSTLSQHLKVLKNAGIIQGEINPPKTKYCINKEQWNQAQQLFIHFFERII